MNGAHDMGGMHGFGPVVQEENEPVFHAEWEGHVYAMSQAVRARGIFNIDESRHGIERMPPAQYLSSSYYERWLATLERNLVEKGVLTLEEIDARMDELRQRPDTPLPARRDPELLDLIGRRLRTRPTAFERPATAPPKFQVGQPVVTRNFQPLGHTRLPRYARARHGVIDRVHGVYVYPDTNAHEQGENPEYVYSVCFEAGELWGDSAEPGAKVYLDLWESYLEEP